MARRRSWIREVVEVEGGEGGDVSDVLLSVVQCVNMFILPYKSSV